MAEENEAGMILQAAPEGCIASIISFTTPKDACRLALVSRDFLLASESNVVWEKFLPSDCHHIVSRSNEGEALLAEFHKKKNLYIRLADQPILVDGASKSFWLDKSSGKKCWMIAARSLWITWGDTPSYWKWISIPESRFPEVAQLESVWWLEIRGTIQTSILSPGTQYAAYLVFKLTENAFGLDDCEASVRTAGGEIETRIVNITQIRVRRTDGWRELKIGEFFAHPTEDDQVELSLREVEQLGWKRGLVVQGIEVRPTSPQL